MPKFTKTIKIQHTDRDDLQVGQWVELNGVKGRWAGRLMPLAMYGAAGSDFDAFAVWTIQLKRPSTPREKLHRDCKLELHLSRSLLKRSIATANRNHKVSAADSNYASFQVRTANKRYLEALRHQAMLNHNIPLYRSVAACLAA